MSLLDTVNKDIVQAMKSKEEATLRALRGIKSAILLAQTEKGASDDLSAEKEMQLLTKLVKQRKESLDIYTAQNRADLAADEAAEIAVIERYLPAQMSEDELKTALEKIIAETGASGPGDLGKVMGVATKSLAGKADGKAISAMVRNLLAG
ncbi:MAG: GatB/YqeY domain-containing protein [Chitinophagales bacterium]|nr:GatB/YqeY domain-containing protein [Chitinophagales bacterium]HAE14431.1 glutamyl-tRNA amidotransferase [Bacteroidota bacterium]MCB9022152.1 GatB/YqeY domain-containing protein [Chitinophagales bacterium]MCB9031949.1 GatB/YqeY domain-containing protein [Chitinophagales bacterium]HPE97622.1 GatB/YqeY domain-containing protein [Chitinophagales bacterium]